MRNQQKTYQGKEPYIFVSFAHKDSARVMPIIKGLQSRGFRTWYDDGTEAGADWPKMIADRLSNCSCVLVMVSKAFADSRNCRNELSYANEIKKPVLVVLLEEAELPAGMRLQMSVFQTIFHYRYSDEESFLNVLCSAAALQPCYGGVIEAPKQTVPVTMSSKPAVSPEPVFVKKEPAAKARYAFISYSSKNQREADHLRTVAGQKGIATWMAPYDIPAGSKYAAQITKAIRECACFVLVLSNDSQNSDAVDREVELAALTFKKPLVILQIEPVELNDSFCFYLHNQQIVPVPDITRDTPERRKVLSAVLRSIEKSE